MTETPAPATLPLHVGVGIADPIQRDGRAVAVIYVEVEGHTAAHYFEAQQRPGAKTWELLSEVPGLPRTVLAHVCQLAAPENARGAIAGMYRAPAAPGARIAAAIAASGLPHQVDWTGTL